MVRQGGSPPRGRGGPRSRARHRGRRRLTPAWAGRTLSPPSPSSWPTAHPRVGGADQDGRPQLAGAVGSPPRGRGGPNRQRHRGHRVRLTPAWAGRTGRDCAPSTRPSAHPRVGGADQLMAVEGLIYGRLTPAWAGRTPWRAAVHCRPPAHPRVGGADWSVALQRGVRQGSPPRGRGGRRRTRAQVQRRRLTPAWAGRTGLGFGEEFGDWAHPRVGGADRRRRSSGVAPNGSPPRGRGGPSPARDGCRRTGLTPAWAGRTL